MSNQPNSPNDFASIPLPPLPAPVQPFLVAQSASQAPQTQLATFSTVDEAVGVAIDGSEIQTSSREPVLARSISKEPEHRQHLNARAATSDLRTQHQWPAYKQSRPGLVRPGTPAPLSINVLPPPPRAAFIEEGPQSPSLSISARSALSFGDDPSTPRAARAKKELKQSIDWTRFSVQFKDHLLGEDEKASAGAGGSSEWLTRKQNIVKRWTRIGVLGVLALVVVVVIIVVACVRNKEDGPTQPKILDAGVSKSRQSSVVGSESMSVNESNIDTVETTQAAVVAPITPSVPVESFALASSVASATAVASQRVASTLQTQSRDVPTSTTVERSLRSSTTDTVVERSSITSSATRVLTPSSASRMSLSTVDASSVTAAVSAPVRPQLHRRHISHPGPDHLAAATAKRFFNPVHIDYMELHQSDASIFDGDDPSSGDDEEFMKVKQDKLRTRGLWRRDTLQWQDFRWTRKIKSTDGASTELIKRQKDVGWRDIEFVKPHLDD